MNDSYSRQFEALRPEWYEAVQDFLKMYPSTKECTMPLGSIKTKDHLWRQLVARTSTEIEPGLGHFGQNARFDAYEVELRRWSPVGAGEYVTSMGYDLGYIRFHSWDRDIFVNFFLAKEALSVFREDYLDNRAVQTRAMDEQEMHDLCGLLQMF